MATRTVAAGGGIFASASTWINGVAPVAGDSIYFQSYSGNLTLGANTVSLIGAYVDAAYTGTLDLNSRQLIFNTAGGTGITLASGMSISYTTGYFYIQQNQTLTTNGKPLPLDTANGTTITLSGTASVSFLNNTTRTTQFTGGDLIITDTALSGPPQFKMVSPNKIYLRPSGTLTIGTNNASFGTPATYVFDTTNTISIGAAITLVDSVTIEFAKSATWSGSATINGKPTLAFQSASNAAATIVNTAGTQFYTFSLQPALNTTLTMTLPLQLKVDNIMFENHNSNSGTPNTQTRGIINILGSGGFTASNLWVQGNFTTVAASSFGQVYTAANTTVKLTSDATYYVDNLQVTGTDSSRNGILQSYTASTPVNMYITGATSSFANAQIIDINNLANSQYALTANGNTLTRTTGFISSVSNVAGGSFTYVN
jgi:hypothetical protein